MRSSSSGSTASRSGRFAFRRRRGIYKDEKGFNPCAVTVAPDGSIFIADGYGSNYVLKFDKDRKFVKAFGGPGEAEGKFKTCHGIALDTRAGKPLLLVCNRNNNRVEHWDLDGNFVRVIQKDLRMPAAVHIRGDYAVVPELQGTGYGAGQGSARSSRKSATTPTKNSARISACRRTNGKTASAIRRTARRSTKTATSSCRSGASSVTCTNSIALGENWAPSRRDRNCRLQRVCGAVLARF